MQRYNNNMYSNGHYGSYAEQDEKQANSKYNIASVDDQVHLVMDECNHRVSMKLKIGNSSPIGHNNEGYGTPSKITSPSFLTNKTNYYNNSADAKPIASMVISHTSFKHEGKCLEIVKGSVGSLNQQQSSPFNSMMEPQQHRGVDIIGKMINIQTKDIIEDDDSSLGSTNDDGDQFFLSLPPSSSQIPIDPPSLLEHQPTVGSFLTQRHTGLLQPRPSQSSKLLRR